MKFTLYEHPRTHAFALLRCRIDSLRCVSSLGSVFACADRILGDGYRVIGQSVVV
jgi:hypothetical protein